MVSIDQINAFIDVYEGKGYSVAAKKLGKGRTTVRELILTLEDNLELLLFEVIGRQAKATENAQRLYPHAKLLQSQLIGFSGLTASLHEVQESQLVIHSDAMLPDAFMVSLTSSLYEKFPSVELCWSQKKWQCAIDSVANNGTQIAFLANKKHSFIDPHIKACFLGFNDFALFAGKYSPLCLLEHIDKLDLRNNVQLIPQSMLEGDINGYIRFANNHISVSSNDEVCRLLMQLGWAILPTVNAVPYVQRGEIKKIRPDFMFNDLKMSMATYYRPAINRGPAMTYLLSLLPKLSQEFFS
ncbi:LysR family transcriptional regulator [Psychromonas hadalis]|uniref:LysR family transcriptional regulator n=1 Tax=Psychromonas hadalis TaxID=211669 RepID=UPI0003B69502|nr:LysR family transcriptional regulator [Psychromonas hadalis]